MGQEDSTKPPFKVILLITIVVLAIVVYSTVVFTNKYLKSKENAPPLKEIKPVNTLPDNIRIGNLIMKFAGALALLLLIIYVFYRKSKSRKDL